MELNGQQQKHTHQKENDILMVQSGPGDLTKESGEETDYHPMEQKIQKQQHYPLRQQVQQMSKNQQQKIQQMNPHHPDTQNYCPAAPVEIDDLRKWAYHTLSLEELLEALEFRLDTPTAEKWNSIIEMDQVFNPNNTTSHPANNHTDTETTAVTTSEPTFLKSSSSTVSRGKNKRKKKKKQQESGMRNNNRQKIFNKDNKGGTKDKSHSKSARTKCNKLEEIHLRLPHNCCHEYELLKKMVQMQAPPPTPIHPRAMGLEKLASSFGPTDGRDRKVIQRKACLQTPRLFQLLERGGGIGGYDESFYLKQQQELHCLPPSIRAMIEKQGLPKPKKHSSTEGRDRLFDIIARKFTSPWGEPLGVGITHDQRFADQWLVDFTRIQECGSNFCDAANESKSAVRCRISPKSQHQRQSRSTEFQEIDRKGISNNKQCSGINNSENSLKMPYSSNSSIIITKEFILRILLISSRGNFLSCPDNRGRSISDNKSKEEKESGCSPPWFCAPWFNLNEWFSLPKFLSSRFEMALRDAYAAHLRKYNNIYHKGNKKGDDNGVTKRFPPSKLEMAIHAATQPNRVAALYKAVALATQYHLLRYQSSFLIRDTNLSHALSSVCRYQHESCSNVTRDFDTEFITSIPLLEIGNLGGSSSNSYHHQISFLVCVQYFMEHSLALLIEKELLQKIDSDKNAPLSLSLHASKKLSPDSGANDNIKNHLLTAAMAKKKKKKKTKNNGQKLENQQQQEVVYPIVVASTGRIIVEKHERIKEGSAEKTVHSSSTRGLDCNVTVDEASDENIGNDEQEDSPVLMNTFISGSHLSSYSTTSRFLSTETAVARNKSTMVSLMILEDVIQEVFDQVGLPPDLPEPNTSISSNNTNLARAEKVRAVVKNKSQYNRTTTFTVRGTSTRIKNESPIVVTNEMKADDFDDVITNMPTTACTKSQPQEQLKSLHTINSYAEALLPKNQREQQQQSQHERNINSTEEVTNPQQRYHHEEIDTEVVFNNMQTLKRGNLNPSHSMCSNYNNLSEKGKEEMEAFVSEDIPRFLHHHHHHHYYHNFPHNHNNKDMLEGNILQHQQQWRKQNHHQQQPFFDIMSAGVSLDLSGAFEGGVIKQPPLQSQRQNSMFAEFFTPTLEQQHHQQQQERHTAAESNHVKMNTNESQEDDYELLEKNSINIASSTAASIASSSNENYCDDIGYDIDNDQLEIKTCIDGDVEVIVNNGEESSSLLGSSKELNNDVKKDNERQNSSASYCDRNEKSHYKLKNFESSLGSTNNLNDNENVVKKHNVIENELTGIKHNIDGAWRIKDSHTTSKASKTHSPYQHQAQRLHKESSHSLLSGRFHDYSPQTPMTPPPQISPLVPSLAGIGKFHKRSSSFEAAPTSGITEVAEKGVNMSMAIPSIPSKQRISLQSRQKSFNCIESRCGGDGDGAGSLPSSPISKSAKSLSEEDLRTSNHTAQAESKTGANGALQKSGAAMPSLRLPSSFNQSCDNGSNCRQQRSASMQKEYDAFTMGENLSESALEWDHPGTTSGSSIGRPFIKHPVDDDYHINHHNGMNVKSSTCHSAEEVDNDLLDNSRSNITKKKNIYEAELIDERNAYRDMCLTLGAEVSKLRNLLSLEMGRNSIFAAPAAVASSQPPPSPNTSHNISSSSYPFWRNSQHGSFDPEFIPPVYHDCFSHGIRTNKGAMSDAGFHRSDYGSSVRSEDGTTTDAATAIHGAPCGGTTTDSSGGLQQHWQEMAGGVANATARTALSSENSSLDHLSFQFSVYRNPPLSSSFRDHSSTSCLGSALSSFHGLQSRLTKDIFNFVQATSIQLKNQTKRRQLAITRLNKMVNAIWPRAQVKLYGSHVTGLCLPSSDIDFVICLPAVQKKAPADAPGVLEGRNAINETSQKLLARILKGESWIDVRSIKLIERTVVPVIKVSTKDTRVRVLQLDISFDAPAHNGLAAIGMVSGVLQDYPAVRPLVLVLKQFLLDRGLSTSYTGGLSSYCLFLMVTRYLQEQPPITWGDCGSLLMGFLDFYGNTFDPRSTGISVRYKKYFSRHHSTEPQAPSPPSSFTKQHRGHSHEQQVWPSKTTGSQQQQQQKQHSSGPLQIAYDLKRRHSFTEKMNGDRQNITEATNIKATHEHSNNEQRTATTTTNNIESSSSSMMMMKPPLCAQLQTPIRSPSNNLSHHNVHHQQPSSSASLKSAHARKNYRPPYAALTTTPPYTFDPLFVEDPLNSGNNVGRNAFRIFQVKRAFADAHRALHASLEWDISTSSMNEESLSYPLLKCLLQNEDIFYDIDHDVVLR